MSDSEEVLSVPPEEKEGDNAEAGGGEPVDAVSEDQLEDADDHGDPGDEDDSGTT